MKRTFFLLAVVLAFFLMALGAFACTPCPEIWDFEKTAENADLIIVGQKLNDNLGEDSEFIDVRVIRVLRGSLGLNQIRVKSFYGMCPYGIIVDNQTYVMLLEETDSDLFPQASYGSVNWGCGQKTYLVEGNLVNFGGEKISLEEFSAKLGPRALPQPSGSQTLAMFDIIIYGLVACLLALVAIFVILKMRKRRY